MTPIKKTLTAAGLGTAMFVGGVFGATTSDVTSAGAQDADTPDAPEVQEEQDSTERSDRSASKAERRAAIAEVLGMTADELTEALSSGSTLAEIAEAQGVDVQNLVDFLVAQANEKIDEAVADGRLTDEEAAERRDGLAEKVEAVINGEGGSKGHRGNRGHHGNHGNRGQQSETIADVLGISAEELQEAKAAGTTIAELAEANGVSVDAVVEALVADAAARIDVAVESGRITEEDAADKLAQMEEKIEAIVNGEADFSRSGRRGGQRGGFGGADNATEEATA